MQNYNCKNCGAVLFWDPAAECLKCDFCEETYQVSDFEDKTVSEEQVKDEALDNEYVAVPISEDMVVYECKTCGGEVVALETTMATICPYCGEAISITSKSVGDFRPEYVIPFTKTKEEIMKAYKEYVSKSFLTPKKFKDDNVIEKIQGLFVPFYLHTMKMRAKQLFEGETTSSHRSGDDKIVTHKVYNLAIDARASYNRVPTDASKKIDNTMMAAVEPFHYSKIKEYNPAYMAGFMAEQRNDDKNDMRFRAEERCEEAMTEKAKKQFSSYSSISVKKSFNDVESYSEEYVMLPVWFLNVTHVGKKYLFAINGQTGKVVGHLPIDKIKLFLIGLGSFVGIDIIVAMFNMLF